VQGKPGRDQASKRERSIRHLCRPIQRTSLPSRQKMTRRTSNQMGLYRGTSGNNTYSFLDQFTSSSRIASQPVAPCSARPRWRKYCFERATNPHHLPPAWSLCLWQFRLGDFLFGRGSASRGGRYRLSDARICSAAASSVSLLKDA
jgi:hypothetical protein